MARMMGLLHDYLDGSFTGNTAVRRYGIHRQRQTEKRELTKAVEVEISEILLDSYGQCGVCGEIDDEACGQRC